YDYNDVIRGRETSAERRAREKPPPAAPLSWAEHHRACRVSRHSATCADSCCLIVGCDASPARPEGLRRPPGRKCLGSGAKVRQLRTSTRVASGYCTGSGRAPLGGDSLNRSLACRAEA